ncbi:terminase gpP N-terminus-related DNA-binding protein [Clostridioides difficile]
MRELKENKIKDLYLKGYRAKEIATTLEIGYESVRKYIARNCKDLKEIHKKNNNSIIEEIRKLYSKGHNAKEIAHVLHKNIDMIEKNIIRNCEDLKKIHKKNNDKAVDIEEVRKLYLKGCNAKEIAHVLHKNIDMIEKNIIRNCEDLKKIHKKNSDKAVDIEEVRKLYLKGYNAKEIATILSKDSNTINLCIYRNCEDLKKIHKKNNEKVVDIEVVRRLYLKGYSAKEIADTLNKDANTVNLCIYRNCIDLKKIHKENRIIRKDTLNLLDRHNKTYINDSSLLKYNRQSYKNDKNGDIKFDDKRGLKPYDIPKRYKKNIY